MNGLHSTAMIAFKDYYHNSFQRHLYTFFSTIPEESKFHEDPDDKRLFSIQKERLTLDFTHLDFLSTDQRVNFGVALFFTILVDEVCYTYFKGAYASFQKLTRYPKFIGNCRSGCRFHLHTRDVFSAMNYRKETSLSQPKLDFKPTLREAVAVMEGEVRSFMKQYFPSVDADRFWRLCIEEVPYTLLLSIPAVDADGIEQK